jgi:hypothetical protein
MEIRYSKHLENRIVLRKIDKHLPKKVFESSKEKYLDILSGHYVAVARQELYGKNREIMIAYKEEENWIKIITIHPLKEGQKGNRITSGRWRSL